MYLKRIEIQGFKSFADKTIIEFKDKITAIVGPNGSGKSNISDAIRWVLGEQSVKYLRGSKMEDVIFSGTDKRRPLGFAEVTIIFDNSDFLIPLDYNEVSIKRRMFRSGESEYYINNHLCRLKDIRRLIMDTGIGKEGYSIIGQGRIDEILSNRPEDRRNIFEEAAGIVKYKSKKEESLRKLNNTEENLLRISDLISEVSDQYKRLESDAEKASSFAKIYEELKSLEINLSMNEYRAIEVKLKDLTEGIKNISLALEDKELEKVKLEESNRELEIKIKEVEDLIEGLREEKDEAYKLYERGQAEISLLNEGKRFCIRDLSRLNEEKENLNSLMLKNSNNIGESEELRKSIGIDYSEAKKSLEALEKDLRILEKGLNTQERKLENDKETRNLLSNKVFEVRNDLKNLNTRDEEIRSQIKLLEEEAGKIVESINVGLDDLNHAEYTCESLAEGLQKEKDGLKTKEVKKAELEGQRNRMARQIREKEIELNSNSSNLRLYKNMEESYEGYYKSVKNLLSAIDTRQDLQKGFIGSVGDLIQTKKIYEKAINISLGSSIQNIVVETENDGRTMIEYLKTNNLGRVTFLPLNTIKASKLELKKEDYLKYGIHGLGSDVLSYDSRYDNIFKFLLGRTIIIDNIENASRFSRAYGYKYRLVTLEGEVINPGGSLTGGSFINNRGSILNRKKLIKEIENLVFTYKEDLLGLKTEEESINEKLNLLKEEMELASLLIREKELELVNKSNYKIGKSKEIDQFKIEKENIACKLIDLKEEIHKIHEEEETKTKYLDQLNKDYDNLSSNNDQAFKELKELRESRESLVEELSNKKIGVNILENKLNNIEEKSQEFHKNKKGYQVEIKNKEEAIENLNKELEEIDLKKINLIDNLKVWDLKGKSISQELDKTLENRASLKEEFSKANKLFFAINEDLNEKEKDKNKLDLKTSKLELEKDNIINRLLDNYEISFEEAIGLEGEISNLSKARSNVKELKVKIRELGNVNLSAIEEYKQVKERLEFLEKQHEDLVQSKESLQDLIEDMDKKMHKLFIASFEEINKNFSEIFSNLFNGGKASLYLEDGENILDSGIEIEVEPPGKRLQNINLLSGGEKSLTAVAILFAILKTRPSPFCILDEIDAALDEANISRYTEYLNNFKEDTQFILITHRKTTMEIANVLYGVTMENEGVSKLVSVKLKKYLADVAS